MERVEWRTPEGVREDSTLPRCHCIAVATLAHTVEPPLTAGVALSAGIGSSLSFARALAMPLLHVLSCSHGRPWELCGHAAGGQLGPT